MLTVLKLFSVDLLRYLPGQVGLGVLAFISVPIFTRILSPEQFGKYSLVMATVGVLLALVEPLTMAIVRFYPAVEDGEVAIFVRTTLWAQLILVGSVAAAVGTVALMGFSGTSKYEKYIYVGLAIVVFEGTSRFLAQILRARLQIGSYNLFTVCTKSLSIALGVILVVKYSIGELGILLGIGLAYVAGVPWLWKIVLRRVRFLGPTSLSRVVELMWYGIPLVVGNLAAWMLSQMDRYLIQFFYGAREVGVYSAAYSISENSIKLVAALFMLSSTPLLANAWEKQGQEASGELLTSVTRLYLLVGIPAVVGLSALAEPLMRILTGPAFEKGYPIVSWVVVGAFFLGLQQRFNQILRLLKRTDFIMLWVMASGVLNLALNWWLLPILGYTVAAVNTFVCYLVLCLGQAWTTSKYFHWQFPWRTAVRSVVAAGFMYSILYSVVNTVNLTPIRSLCVGVPLGFLIYALGIWQLGEVSRAESKSMELFLRRKIGSRYGRA